MHHAIERYATGAGTPARATEGLSKSELLATPIPGKWSIQQCILHLMDSDLVGSDRIKRVIAEDNPLLVGYNETKFTANLFYRDLDAALACRIFELNRQMTADILRRLPSEAFQRSGIHTERGKETLAELVEGYSDHLDHHMRFINEKREALGKPTI